MLSIGSGPRRAFNLFYCSLSEFAVLRDLILVRKDVLMVLISLCCSLLFAFDQKLPFAIELLDD